MSQSIQQFINEFLDYSEEQDLTRKTKDTRREVLTKLKNYLDEADEHIYLQDESKTRFKVNEFFENSERSPNPPAIHAITKFFSYLNDRKDYYENTNVRNCINSVLSLKKTYDETGAVGRVDRGYLTFDERERLIKSCRSSKNEPLKKEVMLRLIIEAGLSRSEILALRPRKIISENTVNPAKIRVNEKWSQSQGKVVEKEDSRFVAISLDTRIKVNQLIEKEDREPEEHLLWSNPTYRKPKDHLDEILEEAGLSERDLSIKDIQRNLIVDFVEKGIAQHRIQKYFGSKSIVTSDVVDKYSLDNTSSYPLAENQRVF